MRTATKLVPTALGNGASSSVLRRRLARGEPLASSVIAAKRQLSTTRISSHRSGLTGSTCSRIALHSTSSKWLSRSMATSTMAEGAMHEADIVIVGGGVVGLGLACDLVWSSSLPPSGPGRTSITLIEASDLSRLRSWASSKALSASSSSSPSTSMGDGIDWENRVISLTSQNLHWLKKIGVYDYLVKHRLRSVDTMRVWDGLSGALLNFDSADLANASGQTSQISVMVEISNLQQAMLQYIEHGPGEQICAIKDGLKVNNIVPGSKVGADSTAAEQDPWPVVQLAGDESIQTRLLIGADGPNSPVRKYAGIGNYGWPYQRKGLVGTLRCHGSERGEPPVGFTAYQRFLPSGTIAFLPLSSSSGSMVWTLEASVAEALTTLHRDTVGSSVEPLTKLVDAAFRLPWSHIELLFERIVTYSRLSLPEGATRNWSWLPSEIPTEFEWAERGLGSPLPESGTGDVPPKIESLDAKSVASFPLHLKHADTYLGASLNSSPMLPSGLLAGAMSAFGVAPEGAGQGGGMGRTALVGDAAHTIHPLAGQGLNLGIADIRSLSQIIQRAVDSGADLGSFNALKGYARDRYWENQKMLSAVDHLHWLYAGTPVPLAQQADGGRAQRERDGLLKTAAKEAVGRGIVWARSTGLEVINEVGFMKNAFMKQAGSTTTSAAKTTAPTSARSSSFQRGQTRMLHQCRPKSKVGTTALVRHHSTHSTGPLASDAYTKALENKTHNAAITTTPSLALLSPSQRRALRDMLRVDHSGEIAANTIYQGQADMFGALGDIKNRDLSNEMWETEKKHLQVMRALLRQHNVRPSLFLPLWSVAGRVLGGVTALLGPRSAMACTEAVETVIGEHYDDQLKELATILDKYQDGTPEAQMSSTNNAAPDMHPSLPLLSDIIEEFRDDELEHLDVAVENESQQAAGHALLTAVIASGCRGAIWVASKV